MTDAEMTEAVRLARAFDDADSNTMKMGHALTIARALIASQRQVEAVAATERARLVEAIARHFATLAADDYSPSGIARAIRSHNWAPPEEDGNE